MNLGFTTQINGKPTLFVEKILACFNGDDSVFRPKLHTITDERFGNAGKREEGKTW